MAADTEGSPAAEEEQWVHAGKKRKKGKDRENLLGVKLRKASSTDDKSSKTAVENAAASDTNAAAPASMTKPPPSTLKDPDDSSKEAASSSNGSKTAKTSEVEEKPVISSKPAPAGLGLAGYSSDEDD